MSDLSKDTPPVSPPAAAATRRYAWAAAIASLVVTGLALWLVLALRDTASINAETSVLNVGKAVVLQIENDLDNADRWLKSVRMRYQQEVQTDPKKFLAFHAQIRQELSDFPLGLRLIIANQDGRQILNTGLPANRSPNIDVADRDFFQKAQAGDKGLIFGKPIEARVDGQWVLPLARRLEKPNGEFDGVAFVVLSVQAIGQVFSQIDLGANGILNLRMSDFSQVVRHPALSGPNQAVGNTNVSDTFKKRWQDAGGRDFVYLATAPIDGIERAYAVVRFAHSPFYVTPGRATADFEGGWRDIAVLLGVMCLGFTAVAFTVAGRFARLDRNLKLQMATDAHRLEQLRKTEAELRANETRFKNLFLNSTDAALIMERDGGRVSECNRAAEEMLRGTRAQIIGKRPDELSPPEQPDGQPSLSAAASKIESVLAHGSGRFDWMHRRLDGSDFWAEVTVNVIDLEGRQAMFVSWRDISARKHMELALRATQEELLSHQQHLEELVQARTLALAALQQEQQIVLDATTIGLAHARDRCWLWVNQAFAQMMGYSVDELLGQPTKPLYANDDAFQVFT